MTSTNDADAVAALDVRDGPNEWFKQHFDVTDRARGTGKRVLSRLDKLLLDDDISPGEFEAGRRFADSWNSAHASRGCASFMRSTHGGGGGDYDRGPLMRLAAATRFREARDAIIGGFANAETGRMAAEVLRRFVVDDESFNEIGKVLGVDHKTALRRATKALCLLSHHYANVDHNRGRSTMAPSNESLKTETITEC
jgi:hypothetical protein